MPGDGTILILKTGETLAPVKIVRGDFEKWITTDLVLPKHRIKLCEAYAGEPLPDISSISGIVVTGSPSMVTDRPAWSEGAAVWLAKIVEDDIVPVLGLCYGHQLLAHGLGGEVGQNPNGREMGTVELRMDAADLAEDMLLEGGTFPVHMSHVESVLVPPDGAGVLGATDIEPNAVLRFGPRQWGVQFHPEFDADIMRRYVEARREIIRGEGSDPEVMIAAAAETPESTSILNRFATLVG
jgi:GMP synthase (glutamine-hydrolysing)